MVGLIGTKVGMSHVFNSDDMLLPVTLIKIEPNYVLEVKNNDVDGYSAIVLASLAGNEKRQTHPVVGQFTKEKAVPVQRNIIEFRVDTTDCARGDSLTVEQLKDYAYVDVIGTSKGKGFQGVMKRHGFRGGRRSHGSKTHREVGSTGMAATPSRTLKNTKMAGRMPARRVTVQNLRIVSIDSENKLLIVNGAVPGATGCVVMVRNAIKKHTQ